MRKEKIEFKNYQEQEEIINKLKEEGHIIIQVNEYADSDAGYITLYFN